MKVSELRIGNYVKYKNKTIIVDTIYYDSINMDITDCDGIEINLLQPITLTEEWLLKFRFKSNPYNDTYYLENIYFEGCKLVFECNKTRGFTELWSDKFPLVENVHQLQNLYFALTGEELTQVSEGENKNFV